MMIRGVGDPLVAVYLRAYLARKGREIAPQLTEHLTTSFNDYLYTHQIITQRWLTVPDLFLLRVSLILLSSLFCSKARIPENAG